MQGGPADGAARKWRAAGKAIVGEDRLGSSCGQCTARNAVVRCFRFHSRRTTGCLTQSSDEIRMFGADQSLLYTPHDGGHVETGQGGGVQP